MPTSMEGIELQDALDSRCLAAIAGVLQRVWPGSATLSPGSLGLDATLDHHHAFVAAVQALCDRGLLAYEALVIGIGGPEVQDAMLTARGRAVLQKTVDRAAA